MATGAIKLAFTVFDLDALLERLSERGVTPLYPTRELGWCRMAAAHDPDGNLVELTQLSDEWFAELEARRARGMDVLARWRSARRSS